MATTTKRSRKKTKRTVTEGRLYIQVSFNNTIITVTDMVGNCISSSSSGSLGFRGAKKSTPFAAQITANTALKKAIDFGLQYVHVFVKGPGLGRESAIRAAISAGLTLRSITDVTPLPHNGCRPKKKRHG